MALVDVSAALGLGGKEPDLDDESTEIDLNRLSAKDREAILARVTPDDSSPPDAYALAQNEIRREVGANSRAHVGTTPRCTNRNGRWWHR